MNIHCNNVVHYSAVLFFLTVLIILTPVSLYADDDPPEVKTITIEDSIKNFIKRCGLNSLGLQTGVVITDEFDTGLGIGAKFPQEIFHPSIELTSSVYFWGASIDSLDVSSIGIEESLTLKRSYNELFSVISGITLGYYFVTEKFDTLEGNILKTIENNNNSFETYITIGTIFSLKSKHSIFTEIKYGLSHDSSETHILFGIIFYR